MSTAFRGLGIVGALLVSITVNVRVDDAQEEAIKKERKLLEGTWRIVALEVNGNKSYDEAARKVSVVNGLGGV